MSEDKERESLVMAVQGYLLGEDYHSQIVGKVITVSRKSFEELSPIDKRELREFAEWVVDLIEKAVKYESRVQDLAEVQSVSGREESEQPQNLQGV